MFALSIALALSVTGATIAVLGDRIGTRVGKRRLSLFGLRPRHTSLIVTTATGALIAVLSLLVALAVSSEARTAVLHLREIQSSLQGRQRDLARVERDLATKRRMADVLARQIDAMLHRAEAPSGQP
jgi:uncharacterized protein (DUF3084 family)